MAGKGCCGRGNMWVGRQKCTFGCRKTYVHLPGKIIFGPVEKKVAAVGKFVQPSGKEFSGFWKKVAAVGRFVQLRKRLFSRQEKECSGLWKKVAAVGKFVQLREHLFSRRECLF